MSNLNNRLVIHAAPSQQAAPKTSFLQRSKNFLARIGSIGKCCSIPNSALSQASATEDMSAASSRSRMDHMLGTDIESWKKILREWINDVENSNEKLQRKTAGERISACIRENGEHLDLSGLNLSSLPPVLHHCKALKRLNCTDNQLTQLDLEGCNALKNLSCSNNQLNQLHLKGCNALKDLSCGNNQLTQLNLEDCNALKNLDCAHNQLTRLNLEVCNVLEYLYCNNNQLTQLNLESCNDLNNLVCRENRLTQLNLKGCNALQNLCCRNNDQLRFNNLDFLLRMRNLRHLEFSNTAIEWNQLPLNIQNNPNIYIDIRQLGNRNQALNGAQNTHAESIHRCASQNAKALKSKHSAQNLNQAYLEFCLWINQLPVDGAAIIDGYANTAFKHVAAQAWIARPGHFSHRDTQSGVSVKEFLALAWLAAQDPAQREPHVPEAAAKEALVNALYEIRRGYNLDDAHNPKDDGLAARNICAGGTFNKISEKLVSVIKGTASSMVTAETFQYSLTNTLKKAVEALRKDNRGVDDELNENDNLLTANVWEKVKAGVIASIKEEFKNYPKIAGKNLDEHIREQTDYDQVLQYFSVL